MKRLLFVCVLILCSFVVFADDQDKSVRRTYLWDVTLSMKGADHSPNVWQKVQDAIVKEIEQIYDESVEIVIIPFQHKAIEKKSVMATPEGKEELIRYVSEYQIPRLWIGDNITGKEAMPGEKGYTTMTKLYSPLKWCLDNVIMPDKINILEIMTDGKSDFPNTDGVEFMKLIKSDWCEIAHEKDIYAFYVMLAPKARDEAFLKNKNCNRMVFFDLGELGEKGLLDNISVVQLIPPKSAIYNIYDDFANPIKLRFGTGTAATLPDGCKVRVTINNSDYMKYDGVVDVASDLSFSFNPDILVSQNDLNTALLEGKNSNIRINISRADDAGMDKYPLSMVTVREGGTDIQLIGVREKRVKLSWK